jgi:hypothetical protein
MADKKIIIPPPSFGPGSWYGIPESLSQLYGAPPKKREKSKKKNKATPPREQKSAQVEA